MSLTKLIVKQSAYVNSVIFYNTTITKKGVEVNWSEKVISNLLKKHKMVEAHKVREVPAPKPKKATKKSTKKKTTKKSTKKKTTKKSTKKKTKR